MKGSRLAGGTRVKLAMLAVVAVVVALVAATIVFNLFIGWKVDADAVGDLSYALGMSDEAGSTERSPNWLLLDSSYKIDRSDPVRCTSEEVKLAKWFASNPEEYTVRRITLDGWTCYAAIAPAADFTSSYDDPRDYEYGRADNADERSGYYIGYIDIASELSLTASVNMAFCAIGIIGSLVAGTAGYLAGKRIDTAQETQKRFYENMSHDLKTPLAAIRGFAEGARDGVVDNKEAARAIVRESDRMTRTIDEILGLSRLEAGAIKPANEKSEVSDLVQDCLMPLEGAVRTKGIDVQLDLAPGEVLADPALFDHALSNVLTNAIRHAATCVRVTYDGSRLAVWNDGIMPDPAQVPHLFDRFHAGEGGSTGIGLAIAKEIAELEGWRISARCVEDGLEIAFDLGGGNA